MNRKKRGRGLISIEECIKGDCISLSDYIKEHNEELIKTIEAEGVVSEDESRQEFKDRMIEEKSRF